MRRVDWHFGGGVQRDVRLLYGGNSAFSILAENRNGGGAVYVGGVLLGVWWIGTARRSMVTCIYYVICYVFPSCWLAPSIAPVARVGLLLATLFLLPGAELLHLRFDFFVAW